VFIVPGFVALKVYDLLVPAERRDFGGSMVEAITYSMVNLAIMSWAVILLRQGGFAQKHPFLYIVSTVGILLVAPAGLAIGVYALRVSKLANRWFQHPMPSGWDYFFRKQRTCWILFHLKNGKKLGGFFSDESFASSYPMDAEVYVEQVWRVDQFGRFTDMVQDTAGMVIRYAECDLIEFFTVEEQ
jgi:hypothetical protein